MRRSLADDSAGGSRVAAAPFDRCRHLVGATPLLAAALPRPRPRHHGCGGPGARHPQADTRHLCVPALAALGAGLEAAHAGSPDRAFVRGKTALRIAVECARGEHGRGAGRVHVPTVAALVAAGADMVRSGAVQAAALSWPEYESLALMLAAGADPDAAAPAIADWEPAGAQNPNSARQNFEMMREQWEAQHGWRRQLQCMMPSGAKTIRALLARLDAEKAGR